MPSLNWIGKEAVSNHDKEVPFRLLKKIKSVSVGNDSQNLIIHGDNLEALKALILTDNCMIQGVVVAVLPADLY